MVVDILTFILFFSCFGSVDLSHEKKLIKFLLERYDCMGKVGRPVSKTTDTMEVNFGIALIQILDLDERNQILTTNCWSYYTWKDLLLKWKPKEFGNITQIRVPIHRIWTPDIVLYNYADERLLWHRNASAVVSSDGDVLWNPQSIFKSSCGINIRNFPFDIQECHLKFGSWTYDGHQLDINYYENWTEVNLNDYTPSNEWDVVGHPAKKNVQYYPCCTEPYTDITFSLRLRRKRAFYNYILILPCVLLSTMNLVVFWLPPESPAKTLMGITVFVAFFVSLLLLAESTPPASQSIPLIGAYYCFNMIMITVSSFISVIVINLYFYGDRRTNVPNWLKRVLLDTLARVLCMRNELIPIAPLLRRIIRSTTDSAPAKDREPLGETRALSDSRQSSSSNIRRHRSNESILYNPLPNSFSNHSTYFCGPQLAGHQVPNPSAERGVLQPFYSKILEAEVRDIRKYIKQLRNRIHQKEERAKQALEWKMVALVIDRLFFYIFLLITILSLVIIFPRSDK